MLKQRREPNQELEGRIPPPPSPAVCCLPSSNAQDELLVETDLSGDRPVTDAELEAIIRLLGGDLDILLGLRR